jgi:hypothetical protein
VESIIVVSKGSFITERSKPGTASCGTRPSNGQTKMQAGSVCRSVGRSHGNCALLRPTKGHIHKTHSLLLTISAFLHLTTHAALPGYLCCSSGLFRRVDLQVHTNFSPEDGDSMFYRNVGSLYTKSIRRENSKQQRRVNYKLHAKLATAVRRSTWHWNFLLPLTVRR